MRAVAYARARLRMPAHAYSRSRLCVRARVRTGACMRALHAHACERVRGFACTRTRVIERTRAQSSVRARACESVCTNARASARPRANASARLRDAAWTLAHVSVRMRTPVPRSPAPPLPPSSPYISAQPPPICWKGDSVQYLARALVPRACTVSRRLA